MGLGECERCGRRPRIADQRYCHHCTDYILRDLSRTGYLEPVPKPSEQAPERDQDLREVARRPYTGESPADIDAGPPPPPKPEGPPRPRHEPPHEPGQLTRWFALWDRSPRDPTESSLAWLQEEARATGAVIRQRGHYRALFPAQRMPPGRPV
jgi:hypothetical protein